MYKDCHVHTKISHDGKSSMQDYLDVSAQKGVDEITFTEHYDVYDGLKTNLKTLNVADYFSSYQKMKEDEKIEVFPDTRLFFSVR